MNPFIELIQAFVDRIASSAGFEAIENLNISDEEVEYAQSLCHPILSAFLEYGWNNGAKSDVPAIRVALQHALYMGMAVKKLAAEGKNLSAEEIFAAVDASGSITEWMEQVLSILHIEADFKQAAKFTALSDACVNYAAEGLPQKIDSGESALLGVGACCAMYFVGQAYFFDAFEK